MWRWFCDGIYFFHCWHWYKESIEVDRTPKNCVGPRAFTKYDNHSECCHCSVVRANQGWGDDWNTYWKTMPEVKK